MHFLRCITDFGAWCATAAVTLACLAVTRGAVASDEATCGAVALEACLSRLGATISRESLIDVLPGRGRYSSLAELGAAAVARGFPARGIRWPADIPAGAPPAIIPIAGASNRLHFVAVLESRGRQVLIDDGSKV